MITFWITAVYFSDPAPPVDYSRYGYKYTKIRATQCRYGKSPCVFCKSLELGWRVWTTVHMMGFNSETWRTVSDGSPCLPSQCLWGQSHLCLRASRLKSRGDFGSPHQSDSRCSPVPSSYSLTILSTRRLRQRRGRHRVTGLTAHRSERLKI